MNNLNLKSQSSNQPINKLYQYISPFERKLKLLEKQIAEKKFVLFPRLNTNEPAETSLYVFLCILKRQIQVVFSAI